MLEAKDVNPYFVAIIDVVGQRNKLKQLLASNGNDSQDGTIPTLLKETSGFVQELRRQFQDYFSLSNKSTGLLDRLAPDERAWLEARKRQIIWKSGFSDSYVLTIPVWNEPMFGVRVGDIHSCLFGLSALQVWALAMRNPLRGAADIGLGVEIEHEEVYGPILAQTYELESVYAEYPRVLLGEGLVRYLQRIREACKDDRDSRHTMINLENCSKLISKDTDGQLILDFIGAGVKTVPLEPPIMKNLIMDGYTFILEQQMQFLNEGNRHLHAYYSQLRYYFESRLSLWDIPVRR